MAERRLLALAKANLVGDIAILPPGTVADAASLLSKQIRVVAIKEGPCAGISRSPQLRVLAGEDRLWTTHVEWGLRVRLNLATCFFTPRMQAERRRVCELVRRDERVLVLCSGVGIWPLVLAARSACREVVAVELNKAAHDCALGNAKDNGLDERVRHVLSDITALPQLDLGSFHRVVFPQPKEPRLQLPCSVLHQALMPGGALHTYCFATTEELAAGWPGQEDIEAIGGGLGEAFHVERSAKCPRGSIGRHLYRMAVDLRDRRA